MAHAQLWPNWNYFTCKINLNLCEFWIMSSNGPRFAVNFLFLISLLRDCTVSQWVKEVVTIKELVFWLNKMVTELKINLCNFIVNHKLWYKLQGCSCQLLPFCYVIVISYHHYAFQQRWFGYIIYIYIWAVAKGGIGIMLSDVGQMSSPFGLGFIKFKSRWAPCGS